ncbi:MAG: RDD family protein [Candidatus Coatesbacteria bacterium]|nr:RDD family protein [Candidatus Coatesbacteria bacterium]
MIYSGFWRRFVAVIIDGVLLTIPMYVLAIALGVPFMEEFVSTFPLDQIENMDQQEAAQVMMSQFSSVMPRLILWQLLAILIPWLYFAFMESSHLQATIGKMAMGSIVTDLEGDRISFLRATGRYFGKIVSHIILMIGFLMAGFTARKQALHDMLAGCLVIQKTSNVKTLYELPE